jgi:hypothetical protein
MHTDLAAASFESAGAPETEAGVTPEMVESGVRLFWRHPYSVKPSRSELGLLLREVFIAMVTARKVHSGAS